MKKNKVLVTGAAGFLGSHLAEKLANNGDVGVSCCAKIVFDKIKSICGTAIMTNPDLPSGTDRVYEIINNHPNANQFECIINLQGDMPLVNPNDIQKVSIPLMPVSYTHLTLPMIYSV